MIATSRAWTILAILFSLCLFSFFSWRAALPANRERPSLDHFVVRTNGVDYYLPRDTHVYDDVVTLVTARNFARDGFLRTHLLPNRRGAPRVSLYDFTGTQCESLAPPRSLLTQWNGFGQPVANLALNHDCIHIHYPPLADWVFGGLACLGMDRPLYYKLVAILLNCGFLLTFYFWLRREVNAGAAFIAIALAGTLPAFVKWADALYFHSFQTIFLILGILSYSAYLAQHRTRWFALSWVLFFAETLVSPQLTLFFAIALSGLSILQERRQSLVSRLKPLWIQAAAPVAALTLHACLCVSLLGLERTWSNLAKTLPDRVSQGAPAGFRTLLDAIDKTLVPWPCLLIGLGLVVAVRRTSRASLQRPLSLLAIFFLGSISFLVAFPGTVSWHGSSIQRHLLPLTVLLLAFVADSAMLYLRSIRTRVTHRASALIFALVLAELGWVVARNVRHIASEVGWNGIRNRHHTPDNLVRSALDLLYWTEGTPRQQGLLLMPVAGLRVNEPPSWLTDFRMLGPAAAHYEIWWLDAIEIRTVRVLTNAREAKLVQEHCLVSIFDGAAFRPFPEHDRITVEDFSPSMVEATPREPYSWVSFLHRSGARSRAVRLTCSDLNQVTLRQIEVD